MRSLIFWISMSFLILSCQSTPESPNVEKEQGAATPIAAPPVLETIKDKKGARKKMSMAVKVPKGFVPESQIQKPLPNTISNCPAGINGSLVGPIENGKHCFTNPPTSSKKCLNGKDTRVQEKAELYCGKLKRHWQRKGLWKFGPGSDLRVENAKRYSCQCGTWRSKPLCKSFFKFNCETIETR